MPSDAALPAGDAAHRAGAGRSIPAQSYLFVPGNKPERFDKALASGADAVIIDLEDAVEPEAKTSARDATARWVSPGHPVLVRINARHTPWFEADAALGALKGVPVYPLIETANGMWNALDIAKAPYVERLMFGTLDFIADMGMSDDGASLNHFRSQLALVSRVAGIEAPVDGVTPDIHDGERIERDAFNGKQLGFGAKLCIHPKQIGFVHKCFRPSEDEVRWAHRIVDAMRDSNGGVVTVDGRMVDRPVLLRATRIAGLAAAVDGASNEAAGE
ncbi:HpcH/HpaI aldolase/citrate lyase family protein [Burkholderia ubonensis]|uniref:HpcH/HpaI aldolase/citrate lyase family protein n=1 Tax=Burkholderia ubonensis TaxID=101571 RepID=UPI00075CE903|nr:CoA ester lyase [Burkholderia ubonensis]KVO44700.1 aldolase [Burkholderia ubonensis]